MKSQFSFILPPRGIPAAEVRQFWQSCVEETRVFARVSPIHKQAPLRSLFFSLGVRVSKIGKFCKNLQKFAIFFKFYNILQIFCKYFAIFHIIFALFCNFSRNFLHFLHFFFANLCNFFAIVFCNVLQYFHIIFQ